MALFEIKFFDEFVYVKIRFRLFQDKKKKKNINDMTTKLEGGGGV